MTIWAILKVILPALGWIVAIFMCRICNEKDEEIESLKRLLLFMPFHIAAEINKEHKEDEKNNEAQ